MAGPILAVCAHCSASVSTKPSTRRSGAKCENVFCDRRCYDEFRAAARAARSQLCERCGSVFVSEAGSKRKYCSDACWRIARKAGPKNCINCGCLFTPVAFIKKTGKYTSINAAKTCSSACQNQWIRTDPERKRKISVAFSGENHPNWQGGKALLNNVGNRGPGWQKKRVAALRRDKYCCVDCGMTQGECETKYGRGLDVDHVVPFHNFSSAAKANVLSNLQSRCASCHRIAEATRSMVQMMLPMQDSSRRGHSGYKAGEGHPNAKFSNADVLRIRKLADQGVSLSNIGRQFDRSASYISSVVSGKIWKSLPLGKTVSISRVGRNGYS